MNDGSKLKIHGQLKEASEVTGSRIRQRVLYCYPKIKADYCFRDVKSMTRNVLASSAILVSVSLCTLVHSLLVLHHLQAVQYLLYTRAS